MKKAETLDLLKIIASFVPNFDTRDESRIKSWNRVLGNMSFADAEKYIYEHFKESRFVPMPSDIIGRARAEFNPDAIVPMDPPDDMRGAAQDAERLRNGN